MSVTTNIFAFYLLFLALVIGGLCSCRILQLDHSKNNGEYNWYGQQCEDPAEFATYLTVDSMECCTATHPWQNSRVLTVYVSITGANKMDTTECPHGFFVQGFLAKPHLMWLHGLFQAFRCSKPVHHPSTYKHCYDEANWEKKCKKTYFYAGMTRSRKMKCCQMADQPEIVDSTEMMKARIMEDTLGDMAKLADKLGFAYSKGCVASSVGEGFIKSDHGEKWVSTLARDCVDGHQRDGRLSIEYNHWKFGIKGITWDEPVYQELVPEVVDFGSVYNNDKTEATKQMEHTERVTQTVSHTATSSWRNSKEIGLSVSVSASVTASSDFAGIVEVSATVETSLENTYSFKYESEQSLTDSTGMEHTKELTVQNSKTVAPYSSAKWRILLTKGQLTIPYTATCIMSFAIVFRGRLKPRSAFRFSPTSVRYQWGTEDTPFCHSLKKDMNSQSSNWMWNYVTDRETRQLIDSICNETRYEVNLTGVFDVVQGRNIAVYWDGVGESRSATGHTGVLVDLKRDLPLLWIPLVFCLSVIVSSGS